MAETIRAAPGDWRGRIVLGCWDALYMPLCQAELPGFALAYIGFSLADSYALLAYDCVAYFNLLQAILVGRRGTRFIRAAHAKGRAVLAWTVNAEEWMDWSIRHGIDGVITDDPAKFARVRKRWEAVEAEAEAETKTSGGGVPEGGHKEGEDAAGGNGPSETTPLRRTAAAPPAPPTAHPPGTRTVTGLYLRRWARLYAVVALLRVAEQVIVAVRRVRWGWEGPRIRTALGP